MIVLYTHAWIWWATDSLNLSAKAAEAIKKLHKLEFLPYVAGKLPC